MASGRLTSHRAAPGFVLRAPVLAFDTLERCGTLAGLRALLDDASVIEAVRFASPELAAPLASWQRGGEPPAAVVRAFARYVTRMAGRATPFGLFAGVAVGAVGEATRLELGTAHRRHARPSVESLVALCDELSRDPEVRAQLRYATNTSLYHAAGRWRYAEARAESYQLVAVDASPELDALLDRGSVGATRGELADVLAGDPELERDAIEGFIDQLIDSQLLVPELEPPMSGAEPSAVVRAIVQRVAPAAVARLDAGAPQLDLELDAPRLALGPRAIAELDRAIELARAIGGHAVEHDTLAAFRDAFRRRYDTREVPLVEVLDEESGIGFGAERGPAAAAPLLAGLRFAAPAEPRRLALGARDRHLLALYSAAIASGALELELGDADLAALATDRPAELADTFAAKCELVAASAAAIDAGELWLRFDHAGGATATRLLGRFGHGSPAIAALLRELAAAEQRLAPGVVLAEIVHRPHGHAANVVPRPALRDHEIWYLGAGGVDRAHRLALVDLAVALDGERIVLRSRALDREVRPMLGSAHDAGASGLAIYRFLCALAQQHGGHVEWTWGALADAPFLPRVRRGRVVLARARWRLERAELARPVDELRAARRLPRWIALADGENELPIDLDNPIAAAGFAQQVRQRDHAIAWELLPGPDALCVAGPGGRFVHELIVPYVRHAPRAAAPSRPALADVPRRFAPGSDWLYVKLYGGPSSLDRALCEVVPAIAEHAERWFFVRYADPDPHLRVRLFGDPLRLFGELAARAGDALASGLVWRVALDTYEREVERYGGALGIELAERVFCADSRAVLAIIDMYRGDPDARWRLALRGVDQLLADLALPIAERRDVVTALRDRFGAELGLDTALQRQLGELYRRERDQLAALLAGGEDHPLGDGLAVLADRSAAIAAIAPRLDELAVARAELARSLVHMHVNRAIAAAQNNHEIVIYDLLRRHYEATASRRRT